MRLPLLAALLAALLLPSAVPVAAQQADAAAPLLSDPAGDVTVEVQGLGAQDDPSPRFASVDVLALDVVEGPAEIAFTLTVAEFREDEPLGEAAAYQVRFVAEDVPYELVLWAPRADDPALNAGSWGRLSRLGPDGQEQPVGDLGVTRDDAAGVLHALVPRSWLTTSLEAPVAHGHVLRAVSVLAGAGVNASNEASFAIGGPERVPVLRARDRMPDDGAVDLPLTLGGRQSGTLRLSSPAPLRATNGGEGSFLMEAVVHNDGGEDAPVTLGVLRAPPGWSVALAETAVRVAPGGEATVPLVLTPTSAHQHGAQHTFLLEARHAADATSWAELEMGLHFVEPAQPAGHHPDLHVHVRDTDPSVVGAVQESLGGGVRVAYLSTLEDDPLDSGVGVQGGGFLTAGPAGELVREYSWSADLHPGLLLGMRLEDGVLPASFAFRSSVPVEDFQAEGLLAHVAPDGAVTPLWSFAAAPVAAAPGADFTVVAEGTRATQRSVFPFEPGAGLRLYLNATAIGPDVLFGVATMTLEGGSMRLPLGEYQDEVAVAGEAKEVALPSPTPAPAAAAGAPAAPPALLLLALAAVAWTRRAR